jgi:hypothetical protein
MAAPTLPWTLWPGIAATGAILLLAVMRYRWRLPSGAGSMLFLLSLAGLLGAWMRSLGHFPYEALKDLPNMIFVVLLLGLQDPRGPGAWRASLAWGARWAALLALPGSVLGLWKLSWILGGGDIGLLTFDGTIPIGTSLCPDYNMYALGLLGCAISAIPGFRNRGPRGRWLGLALAMLHLAVALLAGSRRAWVMGPFVLGVIAWHFVEVEGASRRKAMLNLGKVAMGVAAGAGLLLFAAGQGDLGDKVEASSLAMRFGATFQSEGGIGEGLSEGFQERVERWEATADWVGHASPASLALGDGLDYLYRFGAFADVPDAQDHPHNPILAALLYGGMPFALLALMTLAFPLLLFLGRFRPASPLGAGAVLGLAFGLPSANTLFSLWLMLLPLLLMLRFPSGSAQADA